MKSYRLLVTLAAISGCLLALPAKADLLTVSGSVSNDGETQIYGPLSDSNVVSDSASTSWGSASSWGDASGTYGASVFGASVPWGAYSMGGGEGAATAEFHWLTSVTNNSLDALSYSLDFLVYGGQLMGGGFGVGSASYSLSISRGATTLFTSAVSLDSQNVLTTSSTLLLGELLSYSTYSWDDTNLTLDLGMLGQGESMDIHIDLVVSVSSNMTGCIPGDIPCVVVGASFGDPSRISGSPITITSGPASSNNNVPEPGTLSLLALGLTGFALRARRNRSRG
ncbi:PEP-CTERM sorting domain-containing protein [Azonexus sp.]|jgi:hypothetical protein|uniref:PEP-CTERM sorting domain-containing protein n=1 Tax=Azonexus sp. TaxID=1872668 RepID=UPI00281965EF|nr:PEP-CTERM sorting domain-containing protein [Azonexus sp.]MDR1996281.1 PEP-CTERM sorting domain-containing protein [Azonexus sp.]